MALIISISDYIKIAYKKIFQASEAHDLTREPYLILDFVYTIDGERMDEIIVESRHKFVECSSSSLRDFFREKEPIPLYAPLDPEDDEAEREKISDIAASLVRHCVGVDELKKLHVDIIVEMNQEEEDSDLMESGCVEYLWQRRMNYLLHNVYRGMAIEDQTECEFCAICLDKMRVGEEVVSMPCIHRFHKYCLGKWFEETGFCPLCRFKIELF